MSCMAQHACACTGRDPRGRDREGASTVTAGHSQIGVV